jgi:two-component sensor histidine kinase
MLVQGLASGRDVTAELAPIPLAGQQATALALVFTELFQNALEHGGPHVSLELAQRDGQILLTITDDGAGAGEARPGTGLSIVQALVRDELKGTFELDVSDATRARVAFPYESRTDFVSDS